MGKYIKVRSMMHSPENGGNMWKSVIHDLDTEHPPTIWHPGGMNACIDQPGIPWTDGEGDEHPAMFYVVFPTARVHEKISRGELEVVESNVDAPEIVRRQRDDGKTYFIWASDVEPDPEPPVVAGGAADPEDTTDGGEVEGDPAPEPPAPAPKRRRRTAAKSTPGA